MLSILPRMKHHDLTKSLHALEGDLQAMLAARDCDFWPVFDSAVSDLAAKADDPDDAVYVSERAEEMLSDAGVG